MPRTRWERLIFVLGVAVLAGLLYGVVHARKSNATTRRSPASTAISPPPPPTTTHAATSTAVTTTPATTTKAVTTTVNTAPTTGAAAVTLTAARGASWVEVRAGSARSAVLYAGVLASGKAISFQRPVLWTRIGDGANMDVTVNGKPMPLPGGTYSVTITPRGLGHTRA